MHAAGFVGQSWCQIPVNPDVGQLFGWSVLVNTDVTCRRGEDQTAATSVRSIWRTSWSASRPV